MKLSVAVIEKFEEAEGRSTGEVSIADFSGLLKLKKEICTAQVCFLEFVIIVLYVLHVKSIIYLIFMFVLTVSQ